MTNVVGGAARNIAVTAIGNLGAPLAAFVSAPILARVLGVDGRGEVAAITAPFLLAVSALTLGLPEALTFFVAKRVSQPGRVLARGVALLFLIGAIGTAGIIGLVPVLFTGSSAEIAILVAFALVPSLIVGGIRGYAAGRGLWKLISVERTVSAFARLGAVGVLAAIGNLTVETASISIAVTTFVGGIAYLPLVGQRNASSPQDPNITGSSGRLLSFGARLWFGTLAGVMLSRLDQTLMIPLSDSFQLGIYAVAVSVSEVTLVFNSAVRDVIFSEEASGGDPQRLALASRISTLMTLVLAIAVGISTIWLLPLVFGSDFSPAIVVVEVLLFGIVVGNPGSVAGAGLSARGRPELRSYALVIACIVNVVAVIVLVPTLGALGAAIATVIGNAVAGNLNVLWMKLCFNVPVSDFLVIRMSDVRESIRLVRKLARARRINDAEGKPNE
ncbi:oligosaccharide flippase family protein [Subtercola frigoramans]|uniref:O-antigen/teichoic acid export membrane protein n=1 Tax=Subtercola frigoramans TaxID=120298 RepID=A0ABS2L8J6_9MICO|nr:oligosaccharide flippase family protein [Subtercola frigoramans]MBM7473426.1 O-antigen/teichoic acid export membrane protein [Subtercola frigoramans]